MRIIDAKFLEKQVKEAFEKTQPVLMECLLRWIRYQPTIDAVPVVRCRDCKYMVKTTYGRCCAVWYGVNGMGDDGFCNYGERKEEDNDESGGD